MVESEQPLAATADGEAISYNNDCIIDSGCSNHMAGDNEKLVSIMEYKGG